MIFYVGVATFSMGLVNREQAEAWCAELVLYWDTIDFHECENAFVLFLFLALFSLCNYDWKFKEWVLHKVIYRERFNSMWNFDFKIQQKD